MKTMQTRVYKLYTAAGSTTNAAAQVIIQQRGTIVGVLMTGWIEPDANGAFVGIELSFGSTGQMSTNDTLGPIAEHRKQGFFTAAGTGSMSEGVSVMGLNIPVNSGDRLYLNVLNGDSVSQGEAVYVYVNQ